MLFCVCWVDKTTVTHNDNSDQALLSPRRIDGSGTFARVCERRERTNSMHRNSKREAFVATLAVYTYYKVQSLLSLGIRQNQLLFARVGRGNASCWESGVFLAKASTVAGQWGQKMWTPHPWCPAVAESGWQKPSVNEVQIQYKNKNKIPECVCGESSPHSKYNETIHHFPLTSFPIFQLASSLSLFLLLFHVCILNICQRHPMTSYSHCRAEWNTLRHTSPWKILERREEEKDRDLRSPRLGCRCVQQKDEKQLTSPEWKKKDHLDSVAKCYPLFVLAT